VAMERLPRWDERLSGKVIHFGFVSLIVQLQHSKRSVTTVVISHLQHINVFQPKLNF
jgi:hypothetical protein